MPIETEGLDHNRKCPECEGALEESIGYELCPHCGHRLAEGSKAKTSMDESMGGRVWKCPNCESWNPKPQGGRAAGWHDCPNCGYQEGFSEGGRHQPRDFEYSDMESQFPEGAPHDQLDDPWNAPHFAKYKVVSMGEMQQPGGVGATQTTGPVDGEGIEHPDDHSDMADAGKNSFEQNVALETWVNFAVDMLNRGKSEQEVGAQLAHDGCPEPKVVLQRALEQPQQDPVGNPGAEDPFESPTPDEPTKGMESVHQQPPVLAHWLESPEDKAEPGQQVRIAGTSWRGIELDRWEDLYGETTVKVALNDGGIITVAADVVEADGERKIQDPTTEIQSFIDGLPQVEPTRPSIVARMANLKAARIAVQQNISKVSFSDQVKLERLDRQAQAEISELTDFLSRLASDADMAYVREQQRYRQAGQFNREKVTNDVFNARIAETAAIFVSELAPEVREDKTQVAYAAARFAEANNGDVNEFVKHAISWSDNRGTVNDPALRNPNPRDPGEVDAGWPVRGTGDFPVDMYRDDWITCPHCKGEDFTPDGQCMGCGQRLASTKQAWGNPGDGYNDYYEEMEREDAANSSAYEENNDWCRHCGKEYQKDVEGSDGLCFDCKNNEEPEMDDATYWNLREHGSHPDYDPAEDPFAIWPGGHPMDH